MLRSKPKGDRNALKIKAQAQLIIEEPPVRLFDRLRVVTEDGEDGRRHVYLRNVVELDGHVPVAGRCLFRYRLFEKLVELSRRNLKLPIISHLKCNLKYVSNTLTRLRGDKQYGCEAKGWDTISYRFDGRFR